MTIIDTTLATKTLADLVVEPKTVEVAEPALTKATVDAVLTELKTPQGYGDIAVKVGFDKCTKAQVVEIARKRQEKIQELQTAKEMEEAPVKDVTPIVE
ncbi:MAG: hypothetical protein ACOYUZ_01570 [Patescibacteria group bacterium]